MGLDALMFGMILEGKFNDPGEFNAWDVLNSRVQQFLMRVNLGPLLETEYKVS